MGILDKIADIEREIARTQKNKATEYHLGLLKAKLARYRAELIAQSKTVKEKGEGFEVQKSGDARVVMVGFPSVGKSTLLGKMTKTESVAANYEFTTLTCIPGNLEYDGVLIQLLDVPGIIEGASQGIGRGKQVIAVARTADLILMMLDATKGDLQRKLLEKELETAGIRVNKAPPNIYFKEKKGGGVSFNSTVPLTKVDGRMIQGILKEYKIHNAEVLFRDDCSIDDFVDVVVGNRVYIKCLYCYNKCDLVTIEECDRLARLPRTVVASSALKFNLDYLREQIWKHLSLIRVFTKKRGEMPGFDLPIVLRSGSTVKDVCHGIHKSMVDQFRTALVWGTSAKHNAQRVGLAHVLEDEDVIQIVKR
eukprot:m.485731 g.485731  ORF g.485731 m.485731 type:complete len:365 (-) comp23943_c0_seq1:63-1157(-)